MDKLEYTIIANDGVVAKAESLHLAKIILQAIFDNYDNVIRVCISKEEDKNE